MNDSVMRHTDSTHPIVVTFNVGSATIKMAAYDTAKAADSSPLAWSPLFDININITFTDNFTFIDQFIGFKVQLVFS